MKATIRYIFILLIIGFFSWLFLSPAKQIGYSPKQPIAYDHLLHTGKLGLDCVFCHSGVKTQAKALIPTSDTCMICHKSVGYGIEDPKKLKEYEKLIQSWVKKKQIEWIKIHNLPDHAKFNHAIHLQAIEKDLLREQNSNNRKNTSANKKRKHKIQTKDLCITCHSDVTKLTKMKQTKSLNMGFCVNCHRDYNQRNKKKIAPINCSTCHY